MTVPAGGKSWNTNSAALFGGRRRAGDCNVTPSGMVDPLFDDSLGNVILVGRSGEGKEGDAGGVMGRCDDFMEEVGGNPEGR